MAEEMDEAEMLAMFATKKKKKKGTAATAATAGAEGEEPNRKHTHEDEEDQDTYDSLLHRIYDLMGTKEQGQVVKGLRIKPPQCQRIGSKKTQWVNFMKTAEGLNRDSEHLQSFFAAELGVLTTVVGEGGLLIRGIFHSPQLESCLKKYVQTYVRCVHCTSYQTELLKDTNTRLFMMKCNHCLAVRSVVGISKGFHAVMKGERKKEAAAGV
jgi:translation initiation factor 2 subunit 2